MKKIIWLTDIHLNHISMDDAVGFAASLRSYQADIVLISGDIGEAQSVIEYLLLLDRQLRCDLYFVLGNHDFYGGSIADVTAGIEAFAGKHPRVSWLSRTGVVPLSDSVALVGVESWADGGYGDYDNSPVLLADYFMIREFLSIFPENAPENSALEIFSPEHEEWLYSVEARMKRRPVLHALGLKGADYAERTLTEAFRRYDRVIFLTHVPPFPAACKYQGKPISEQFLPHFCSRATGDALLRVMQRFPDKELTVLCGHTHDACRVRIADNIEVITGEAIYGRPNMQELLIVY